MKIEGEGRRVRIYIGESDHAGHKPLYQAIVELLHNEGVAGATVIRGIEGFGAHSRIHTDRILRLSQGLPMVIEFVDTTERVEAILPKVDALISEGLVTVDPTHIYTYRANA